MLKRLLPALLLTFCLSVPAFAGIILNPSIEDGVIVSPSVTVLVVNGTAYVLP